MRLVILFGFLALSACSTKQMADNPITEPMVNKGIEVRGGKIDRNGIRQVFIDNQKVIAACYEASIKDQPKIAGKLALDFDIKEGGVVSRVGINKERTKFLNFNPEPLSECVIAKMKTWKFPEPPGQGQTVQVIYPLAFSLD